MINVNVCGALARKLDTINDFGTDVLDEAETHNIKISDGPLNNLRSIPPVG